MTARPLTADEEREIIASIEREGLPVQAAAIADHLDALRAELAAAESARDAAVARGEALAERLRLTRDTIVAAREISWTAKFEREHPSIVDGIDAALAQSDASALADLRRRHFEEAAKIAEDAENVHRKEADRAANLNQFGVWSECDGAAITAETIAAALRSAASETP